MAGPLRRHAIGRAAERPAIPGCRTAMVDRAGAHPDQASTGFGRSLGHDVDDAVDGVGAPHRTARPADHLDAGNIVDEHVLTVPEHTGKAAIVERAPIDEHEQLVGIEIVEAANRHRPPAAVHLGHLDTGDEPQQIRERAQPGSLDVVGREHEGRGRDRVRPLFLAARRRDLDAHQLLERRLGQVRRFHLRRQRRAHASNEQGDNERQGPILHGALRGDRKCRREGGERTRNAQANTDLRPGGAGRGARTQPHMRGRRRAHSDTIAGTCVPPLCDRRTPLCVVRAVGERRVRSPRPAVYT